MTMYDIFLCILIDRTIVALELYVSDCNVLLLTIVDY